MIRRIISSIPNTITCCNLLSGCLACIATFSDTSLWGLSGMQLAWILLGAAAIFDFCDGMAARLLHAPSLIGKELDSLADLISFGLAPGMMMYNLLVDLQAPCWAPWIALIIPVLGALRLARFNVDDRQTTSFIGLPIPANAIFWIGYTAWLTGAQSPVDPEMSIEGWPLWITVLLMPAIALMMVSGLKMFSLKFKNLSLRENGTRYFMIIATILLVIIMGVEGLAGAIILYILLSAIQHVRG